MEYNLNNTDPEDLNDIVKEVERSFNIKFKPDELTNVETFGQFCTIVRAYLPTSYDDKCAYQQSFYRLRTAIRALGVEGELLPSTRLAEIEIPKNKIAFNKYLDSAFGFKTRILSLGVVLQVFQVVVFVSGIICLWLNLWISMIFAIVFLAISFFGKYMQSEFSVKTLGDLARKLSWENYIKVKGGLGHINKDEIDFLLTDLFASRLMLNKSVLTEDARFN